MRRPGFRVLDRVVRGVAWRGRCVFESHMWTRGVEARKAEAYRIHVIERAFPVHVVGTMLAILASVVSKVRNPELMALFDTTLPWVDFRDVWAVVSYVLLVCTQHARATYVTHYEIACETFAWVGVMARCSISRYRPHLPWGMIRFVTVVASAMGLRYEIRTQWAVIVAKMATACLIDTRVKQKHGAPEHNGKPFLELLRVEFGTFVFLTVVTLVTQYSLETVDKKKFETAWATRRGARYSRGHGDERRRARRGDVR